VLIRPVREKGKKKIRPENRQRCTGKSSRQL
jgi:hypothetical protein